MPRTLPWLAGDASKKKDAKAKSRARSSSPADLVNSDLDIVSPGLTTPKAKRRNIDRDPSTSPVLEATKPEVEFMREGLNADDAFMMVEDEFDATARLFTQHIHRAEYARLKRLHRSRGADTLAKLGHGTDTTTQQSRAVKIQIEAAENARKRKSAGTDGSDSESEDEDLEDPMLFRLMTEDRRPKKLLAGLGKAKSNTRAAAGYSQSPRKETRTKDVFAVAPRSLADRMNSIAEDGEETDDENLDARATQNALTAAYKDVAPEVSRPLISTESAAPGKSNGVGFFKAFNEKSKQERAPDEPRTEHESRKPSVSRTGDPVRLASSSLKISDGKSISSSRAGKTSNVAEILARRRGMTQQPESRPAVVESRIKKEMISPAPIGSSGTQTTKASDILARRRAEPVKIKEEDSTLRVRTKAKPDDIPTFLF